MADDEESEEPAVTLGQRREVEGAPLAQISARFMWGVERSAIEEREGETAIRTPDGPRELGNLLRETGKTYFSTRQEFEDAIQDVIGEGPVPTAGTGEPTEEETDEAETADEDTDETDTGDDE